MSDKGDTTFQSHAMVQCEFCGETSNIGWFCRSCRGPLCDDCQNFHQTSPLFKDHLIGPRTIKIHDPAMICQVHPTKELSSYCNECNTSCCVLCIDENHQLHAYLPIEDKYLFTEISLNKYLKKLETIIKPTLDTMKINAMKNLEMNNVRIEEVKGEINLFRNRLKHTVDESCDLLLQELDTSNAEFRYVERKLDLAKENIDQLIMDVKFKIGEGKLSLIDYFPPDPKSLIQDLTLPTLKVPNFTPDNNIICLIKSGIGKIELIEQRSIVESEIQSPGKRFNKSRISVRRVMSFPCNFLDSSITFAGKMSAWVFDSSSDTMYKYKSSGKVVMQISVKGSVGINDMVVARSGDIIVTCGDKKVRQISLSGLATTLIDTEPFEPDGVCFTNKDELAVCMRSQSESKHVAVYSADGQVKLREIRGRDSQGRRLITDPYRVVENGQDICIVNKGRNVVCLDQTYDVRWMYNGKDAKIGTAFSPRCICVDKYHNLLVTDNSNHCVHYIDREGELIQLILTQEQTQLWDPLGICIDDETGLVWLGNYSGDVVIAEYLN